MNKANATIKKKALDYVKKRQWDLAVQEYLKLAENEKHNPNVFNELGDLHLKIGNKSEAFSSFHTAVDEYSHNTLYNNAVAVCKKILRLNPNDRHVNRKLASLKARQGLAGEAATYAFSFIDQVASDPAVDGEQIKGDLLELAEVLNRSPEILQRVADCLVGQGLAEEATKVLTNLAGYYADRQMSAELDDANHQMQELGGEPAAVKVRANKKSEPAGDTEVPAAPTSGTNDTKAPEVPESDTSVYEHHRVTGISQPAGIPNVAAARNTPRMPQEWGEVDLGASGNATATGSPTATEELPPEPPPPEVPASADVTATEELPSEPPPPEVPASADVTATEELSPEPPQPEVPSSASAAATEELPSEPPHPDVPSSADATATDEVSAETTIDASGATEIPADPPARPAESPPDAWAPPEAPTAEPTLEENEVWIPDEELPDSLKTGKRDGSGEVVPVDDLIGQFDAEVVADVDAEDHRSHYDLGMAYLEMDLLPESIREFQFAANSSMYQVRCLEMIGLCFLKQNQPRLAIKQLEKGLSLVGDVDKEALGLRYNLGLAYEALGDSENAKMAFEDVYVIDVTFRDVADKVKK